MSAKSQPLRADFAEVSDRAPRRSTLWLLIDCAERIAATTLLVGILPALVLVSFSIALLSRRSPLVCHRRVGLYGQELWILKFRTMWGGTERSSERWRLVEAVADGSVPATKRRADPRVTSRFALFCRRHSIDELPQLWHVVRGDMALIGPRPQTEVELRDYYGPQAATLVARKPGLTGLWQVKGRSSVSRAQRCELDLFMIENWSLRMYLYILQATIPTVISGRNAW